MAEFSSSIGGRKVSGNKLREFDVPDGEDFNVDAAIASGKLKKLDMDEVRQFQNRLDNINSELEENYRSQPVKGTNQQELREIDQARQERDNRKKGIERLSGGAKKRIEMLIGLTRSEKTAIIDDTEYVLQTLKSQEMREALVAASKYDNTVELPYETRLQILSRSLIKVGGITVEDFLNSNDFEDKIYFINEMDEYLLNRLYGEYTILASEASEKYSIKSSETAQEVVADLKK